VASRTRARGCAGHGLSSNGQLIAERDGHPRAHLPLFAYPPFPSNSYGLFAQSGILGDPLWLPHPVYAQVTAGVLRAGQSARRAPAVASPNPQISSEGHTCTNRRVSYLTYTSSTGRCPWRVQPCCLLRTPEEIGSCVDLKPLYDSVEQPALLHQQHLS
jgi:hypothetical protein